MPIVIKFAVLLCGNQDSEASAETLDRLIANGDVYTHYYSTYSAAEKKAAEMQERRPELTYVPVAIAMEV